MHEPAGRLEEDAPDAACLAGLPPEARLVELEHAVLMQACDDGQRCIAEAAGPQFVRGSCLFALAFAARRIGQAVDREALCGSTFDACVRGGGPASQCDLARARPACRATAADFERCSSINGAVLRAVAESTCEDVVDRGVSGVLDDAQLASDAELCRELLDPCVIGSGEPAAGG